MKKYNDSEQGVIDMLKDESTLDTNNFKSFEPDPFVVGVWKVTFKESVDGASQCVVYLGGHTEYYKRNDFELFE